MSQKFLSVTVAVYVLFIVDGCQLNAVPEPGRGPRRGQSFFQKNAVLGVTVGVRGRVRLGLELMSTLTLTLTLTVSKP